MSASALERALAADPARVHALCVAEEARRSGSRSFAAFVKQAWHIFEPAPLQWSWHMEAICNHLEAVARGEIRRLLINVPPRSGKSNLTAILWPAWVWAVIPRTQFFCISYAASLSVEHSVKCRQVIESDWYRTQYARGWALAPDQNVKSDYQNTMGGRRIASSIEGGITGRGADIILVDDPISAEESYSQASRDRAWRSMNEAMATRFNDPKTGRGVVIMQCFTEDDPSGRILEANKRGAGWEHLMIPAEFEPERRSITYRNVERKNGHIEIVREEFFRDPRQTAGELINPDRIPREEIERIKASLGAFAFAGQYQQRPAPEGGGMFKVEDWRFWRGDDSTMERFGFGSGERPRGCWQEPAMLTDIDMLDEQLISIDATFRETKAGSFVAIHVWGKKGARRLLLYRVHRRMDFTETVAAILKVIDLFPEARRKLIEAKANGDAIISTLEKAHGISGIEAVTPGPGKQQRAHAGQAYHTGHNIELPEGASWLGEYIMEHAVFPNGAHDDDVDAQSQALAGLERARTFLDMLEDVELD